MAGQSDDEEGADQSALRLREQHRRQLVGDLAGGVAHEINNPIQSIMNYAQLLRGRIDDPSLSEFAEEILHEAQRVASIVQNLQGLARGDALMMTELAPATLVERTLTLIRSALSKEGIRVEVDVATDLPAVRGRGHELQQALMNLLLGARDGLNDRFPSGDANKRIQIRAEEAASGTEQRVRVTVTDWGTPIAEDDRSRVFEAFHSLPGRDQGGGIGLSISRAIAVEHGGRLSLSSAADGATCFSLELPTIASDG